jgi:UDP-2-acetamido-2-deoxy-ribo-hexuluronate aminotransferase
LLAVRPDRDCVWGQYTVFANDRDHVQAALRAAGIPTAVHYPLPLHRQVAYAAYGGADALARSVAASHSVLSLPMSADLGAHDQARIARALEGASRNPNGPKHVSV